MQLFKKHIENMIKEKQKGIDIYMVEKDKIYAPVSGKIIPLEEVEDAVFSQKIMGDGVGIEPVEGYLYAPVDGKISVVFPTGHVIGIESEDGAGIIMHVVIIGGGSIGCELGVDLAKMGRKVTILELGPVLNRTLNDIMKVALKTEMDKCKNLTAITETSCKEIREHSVITEMEDGSQKEILADTVIFAAGMRARLDEANEYFGIVQDTNIIGDANRVGTVWSALEDGYYISAHL